MVHERDGPAPLRSPIPPRLDAFPYGDCDGWIDADQRPHRLMPAWGRQMGVQPLTQLFLSDGSDQPVDHAVVADQDQERDAADLMAL